jgi:hypothetical protein
LGFDHRPTVRIPRDFSWLLLCFKDSVYCVSNQEPTKIKPENEHERRFLLKARWLLNQEESQNEHQN